MIRKHPYLVNTFFLVLASIFSIALGAVFISPDTILHILLDSLPVVDIQQDWPNSYSAIIHAIRLPHTILIALTGAALACSGAAYQGLFRNPLADPYLIGVAAGAGLGAVFAMSLNWPTELLGYYLIPLGAFVGAGDWQRSMRFAKSPRKSSRQRLMVLAPLCSPSAKSSDRWSVHQLASFADGR